MFDRTSEVEAVVYQALAHPMRRTIIRIVETNPNGVSYTELITELGLSTGKLNYHLEQLEGLIEKNQNRRYILSPLGMKAAIQLKTLQQGIGKEDEKYLKLAEKMQKSSLEPTLKSFLVIGLLASMFILVVLLILSYVLVTEGGAPTFIYVLLPLFIALEVSIIATLIRALQRTPAWLRRLERRFLDVP